MISIKKTHRLTKLTLLFSCALLMTLAVLDNIFAYDINYDYVQHVMSMDTTFKHPHQYWRAVHNPFFYNLCLILIIIFEGVASIVLWVGTFYLLKNMKSDKAQFQAAKQWGAVGLLLTLVLYSLIFMTIASQWFASWQSSIWNSKNASMPFIILFGLTYLLLVKEDEA
ncbi:MAG: DUF2165 domain-containing protein [Proteobacteria bacterium]|nr:DUF2165 domain-containing protein [Pseudomonadota bacterium]